MHVAESGHEVFAVSVYAEGPARRLELRGGPHLRDTVASHDHRLMVEHAVAIHGHDMHIDERDHGISIGLGDCGALKEGRRQDEAHDSHSCRRGFASCAPNQRFRSLVNSHYGWYGSSVSAPQERGAARMAAEMASGSAVYSHRMESARRRSAYRLSQNRLDHCVTLRRAGARISFYLRARAN